MTGSDEQRLMHQKILRNNYGMDLQQLMKQALVAEVYAVKDADRDDGVAVGRVVAIDRHEVERVQCV